MKAKPEGHSLQPRRARPETETRYRLARELYRTTELPVKIICEQTRVSAGGFQSYIQRFHRDLLFARHGITVAKEKAATAKLRKNSGQSAATHAKYREAINACDDIRYIDFNVSQIAGLFGLNPSALSNQLRRHYPEILERRERERSHLGINDNLHRGVKPWCKEHYAAAVEHLRASDDTIRETAELYDLSYSGLREHLLYYYKELIRKRADKREHAKTNRVRGRLSGNGGKHEPTLQSIEKYREAIRLYRTTALTQEAICAATGVTAGGLRYHLRMWHCELSPERRETDHRKESDRGCGTKKHLKSTAAKYAAAIGRLRESGRSTAEVAREFGLHPETFREYLHGHAPELAAALGMTKLANGKTVLARSAEKYDEAVRLYETTAETLKSIAKRLDLPYNSVGGFIRRNRPDAIKRHNSLVKAKTQRKQEQERTEAVDLMHKREEEERKRIQDALEHTGNNRKRTAELLEMCKSTFYNKLNALNIKFQSSEPPVP